MKGDNRWNAQLGGYKDNGIREPKPVVDMNQIRTHFLQMLAKKQLGLRIIRINLSFTPLQRKWADVARDRRSLFLRGDEGWRLGLLFRASQDKAAMTPILQGTGERLAVQLRARDRLWRKPLDYLKNAQSLPLLHPHHTSIARRFWITLVQISFGS